MEPTAMPLKIGLVMKDDRVFGTVFQLPLAKVTNGYIFGSTGSGKSYLLRVIVEEASQYDDLNILVLDPRNQAAGLLVAEDREDIFGMYAEFRMKRDATTAFPFTYYAPGQQSGERLPADLARLGQGRSIVSFKGLDDRERCTLFHRILDAVFEAYAVEETETLRLLVLVEEARLFTKNRVIDEAKAAGARAENALERMVREIRKYGAGA